jgi:CopG family nickel-responsive transcriptional regulator
MPAELARVTISLDEPLLDQFDDYVYGRGYPTRSEAVRDLIRDKLLSDESEASGDKFAVLSVLFEMKSKAPARIALRTRRIADMIRCTMQTPVGDDHLLSIFIMEGSVGRMRRFADAILSIKGVLHGELKFTGGVAQLAAFSTPRSEPKRRPAKAAS